MRSVWALANTMERPGATVAAREQMQIGSAAWAILCVIRSATTIGPDHQHQRYDDGFVMQPSGALLQEAAVW